MQYVGWSDGQSALRYVEGVGIFTGQLGTSQPFPAVGAVTQSYCSSYATGVPTAVFGGNMSSSCKVQISLWSSTWNSAELFVSWLPMKKR